MKRAATHLLKSVALFLAATVLCVRADVLTGANGERFVGTIISETSSNIVFDSELGGQLTFPRDKILALERNVSATNNVVTAATAPATDWKPPGVGTDGSDWVQLKSGEWLRGELKYIQNKEVEFDSDEMELQTLKLKDVSKIYTAHRVYTQFIGQKPVLGQVVISNRLVTVKGDEPFTLDRDLLIGVTPSGGKTGVRDWAGNVSLSLAMQSGNHHQTTYTTMAELSRRTPATTFLLDYIGNYSQANGVESANNNRVNTSYDVRVNQDWFVRPVQLEYYQDPLANVAYRLTGGASAGYYVFDRTGLEWTVSAGPGYQYTRFSTVETNQSDTATTPAAVLNSKFKADITDRLTFIQSWQSIFTSPESGQYSHHAVSTLEFEIKRHLNLDVSLVWDYLQIPQTKADGETPQKSDYYLNVGLGMRF